MHDRLRGVPCIYRAIMGALVGIAASVSAVSMVGIDRRAEALTVPGLGRALARSP